MTTYIQPKTVTLELPEGAVVLCDPMTGRDRFFVATAVEVVVGKNQHISQISISEVKPGQNKDGWCWIDITNDRTDDEYDQLSANEDILFV